MSSEEPGHAPAAGSSDQDGPILVTGGTGTLGRAVVRELLERGHRVRVLSRRPRPDGGRVGGSGAPGGGEATAAGDARAEKAGAAGGTGQAGQSGEPGGDDTAEREPGARPVPEWATGDLTSGEGLDAAVSGARSVVHCATTGTRKDVIGTRRLVEALRRSGGATHLIYISIVGVDAVPFFYYRAKLDAERIVQDSGLPWTILRATQFHDLIARLTTVQRRLPFVLYPAGLSFQPVEVDEVAERLAELAAGAPAGRVADMGGPEVRTSRELAQLTLHAYGRRRSLVPVPLAGKAARGYKAGHHTTPGHAVGRRTYAEYLAAAVADSAGAAAHQGVDPR